MNASFVSKTSLELKKQKLQKQIAKFFSVLLHPVFMPTYGMAILLGLNTYIAYTILWQGKLLILATVFLNTALIPIISSFTFLKVGAIKSIEMENKKERTMPFIITTLFFYMCYYLIGQYNLPPILSSMILGATVSLVFAIIVNLFWKISIHMLGIGGLVGGIIAAGQLLNTPFLMWFCLLMFLSGLLGSARLILHAHSPSQVYLSFIAGGIIQYLVLVF